MAAPGGPPLISIPWENEGPRILGATLSITTIALLTVVARQYVRLFLIRSPGWDDFFMVISMALSITGQIVVLLSVQNGAGRHMGDVDMDVFGVGMKLNFISQPIYLWGICIVKLAVGAALIRIATEAIYRRLILGTMYFVTIWTTVCFFTLMFQCTDIRVMWDPSVTATCWSQKALQGLSFTNVALNILTDFMFAVIIPVPMLWNLNVNRRTRGTLIGILGLGVFACAAAITKIPFIIDYGKNGDWLWDSRNLTIWTVVEMNVGIIAGSLACLRPLFRTILGSTYGQNSNRTPGASGTKGAGAGSGYAGRSVRKSGSKNWQSLSSGRQDEADLADEASSERAINAVIGREEYELRNHVPKGFVPHSTVINEIEGKSSEESSKEEIRPSARAGIVKTTRTAVNFSRA